MRHKHPDTRVIVGFSLKTARTNKDVLEEEPRVRKEAEPKLNSVGIVWRTPPSSPMQSTDEESGGLEKI